MVKGTMSKPFGQLYASNHCKKLVNVIFNLLKGYKMKNNYI